MPLWPNFIGPSYRTQSATIAADAAINIYLETTRNPADPKKATYYGTPGQLFTALMPPASVNNCRGLFSQDGRVFGVNGEFFFEFHPPSASFTVNGITSDGKPVTFASNGKGGNQLAICSDGKIYILNLVTNVFTGPIALPGGFVPVMIDYMDGYFLANEKNTPKMWFSNLFNGLVWSATDFFTRSSTSDNITGFAVNNRRVWVIGTKTTEIFQDSGDPTTPFIPYPGTVINEGTAGYASIISIADTVCWAGTTTYYGNSQIFAASSLQPRVISTPPISASIALSVNAEEAEALCYSQNGHDFVCWTWPSIEVTWCYDLTEDAWHQRSKTVETTPGVFTVTRWPARGSCAYLSVGASTPLVLVGQWATRFLCTLDLATNADADSGFPPVSIPIVRQRAAPYLGAENQWLFLQQLELGLQQITGGMPAGRVQLLLSANNGTTFGPAVDAAPTLEMAGSAVAQWFQLGRYRSDRLVIAIRQTAVAPCVWGPGLWLRLTPGTGLL